MTGLCREWNHSHRPGLPVFTGALNDSHDVAFYAAAVEPSGLQSVHAVNAYPASNMTATSLGTRYLTLDSTTMLLGDYGSDSESDNEAGPSSVPAAAKPAASVKSSQPQAPAATSSVSAANPPRPKKRGGPVRITLDLPKASTSGLQDDDEEGARARNSGAGSDDDGDDGPDAKKPKTGSGGIKGGKGSYVSHKLRHYD